MNATNTQRAAEASQFTVYPITWDVKVQKFACDTGECNILSRALDQVIEWETVVTNQMMEDRAEWHEQAEAEADAEAAAAADRCSR